MVWAGRDLKATNSNPFHHTELHFPSPFPLLSVSHMILQLLISQGTQPGAQEQCQTAQDKVLGGGFHHPSNPREHPPCAASGIREGEGKKKGNQAAFMYSL